jgi:hypothetical protein
VLGVETDWVDELILEPVLAAEVALRQRGTVIRRLGLGPDHYLDVMLDVFSRYVVGWMGAERERATFAERFIRETCVWQGIARDQLTTTKGTPFTDRTWRGAPPRGTRPAGESPREKDHERHDHQAHQDQVVHDPDEAERLVHPVEEKRAGDGAPDRARPPRGRPSRSRATS